MEQFFKEGDGKRTFPLGARREILLEKDCVFCEATVAEAHTKTFIDEQLRYKRWDYGDNNFFGYSIGEEKRFRAINTLNIHRSLHNPPIRIDWWRYNVPRIVKPFYLNPWYKRLFGNNKLIGQWFT